MINVTNTKDIESINRSYLVFGGTKTGKTLLVTTLPAGKTLLVNVENNLDSIAGADVMKVDCFSAEDWKNIYLAIKDRPPEWLFIDSISALMQRIYNKEHKDHKDGRAAYSSIEREYNDLVAQIKSLKCNVVCVAQRGFIKDEITGGLIYGASLPWAKLEANLPYNFSAVVAARSEKDPDGKTHYFLQCHPDSQYQVGVRTNYGEENPLDFFEAPNLLALHNKISNSKKGE